MQHLHDHERLAQDLDVRGYAIIPGCIPPEQCLAIAERLRALMHQDPDHARQPFQNLNGVFNAIDTPEDARLLSVLCQHPTVMALARHAVGDGFQISATGALWLKPRSGSAGVGWHADVPTTWFTHQRRTRVPLCFAINCLWMITDFRSDNGATRVLPFSHHAPYEPSQFPRPDYDGAVSVEGQAGSCLVMDNRLWHCAGSNTSDQDRIGVSVPYFPVWLDGGNVGWPAIPRRIHRLLPDGLQQLHRHVTEDQPAPRAQDAPLALEPSRG